jgi:ribosome-associated heat shock protein Hsp15
MTRVRIDKWLWSVRIYKSRTQATEACKSGKIKLDNVGVKASTLVSKEDTIQIIKNGFKFKFKVINPIEKRVSASLAQECYQDLTPSEELLKYKDWFIQRRVFEHREKGVGRPSKKDRREIEDFKTPLYYFEFTEDIENLE